MRRMYSEQELTNIIKVVFEQELEDGAFDDKIKEYAEAWLAENPLEPSGLDFTDIDFVAKTIQQLNPNSSQNISVSTGLTYMTPASIYCKGLNINGLYNIVISATLTENAGNSHSNLVDILYAGITLPAEIASKIYDINGDSVDEVLENSAMVCIVPIKCYNASQNKYFNATLRLNNASIANQLNMVILCDEAQSVSANDVLYISGRVQLTLY